LAALQALRPKVVDRLAAALDGPNAWRVALELLKLMPRLDGKKRRPNAADCPNFIEPW